MFKLISRLKWLINPLFSEGPRITLEDAETILSGIYGDEWPARKAEYAARAQENSNKKAAQEKQKEEAATIEGSDLN